MSVNFQVGSEGTEGWVNRIAPGGIKGSVTAVPAGCVLEYKIGGGDWQLFHEPRQDLTAISDGESASIRAMLHDAFGECVPSNDGDVGKLQFNWAAPVGQQGPSVTIEIVETDTDVEM